MRPAEKNYVNKLIKKTKLNQLAKTQESERNTTNNSPNIMRTKIEDLLSIKETGFNKMYNST